MSVLLGQRYRVEDAVLGEPGVYAARDLRTGARVALKFFPEVDSDANFRREASLAMRARHPNLVGLLDAGVVDGRGWLVFDYVPGIEVRRRLRSYGPMGVRRALDVGAQLFGALDALHRRGIAHGDIKPDNVLLEEGRVRVFDYGVGRVRPEPGGRKGMYPATPEYMHPSLYVGGVPDARTDSFAAWVTIYELLAGRRPYTVRALRAGGELPAPASVGDEALDRLVAAGLSGRLGGARAAWVAITRFLRGRLDVLEAAPPEGVPEGVVARILAEVAAGRSVAVGCAPECGLAALEGLHAAYERGEGWVLWARAGWGSPDEPLSGALAVVADATDALPTEVLESVREALGPAREVLARAVPAARTWLGAADLGTVGPGGTRADAWDPERAERAVAALLAACPRPLLVLVEGLDQLDARSRAFFTAQVAAGRVVVAATVGPTAVHAFPAEVRLPEGGGAGGGDARLTPAHREIVAAARVLGLPLGPRLAVALGLSEDAVADAALEAEAVGAARWNGGTVTARPGPMGTPADAVRWYRAAASRLDPATEPRLVERYARLGREARA